MHFRNEEDHRNELLIWILIGAFGIGWSIDQQTFDSAVMRYKRELEKRGVKLNIFFDLISGKSEEVFDACVRAMEFGILSAQPRHGSRAEVIGNVDRFLYRLKAGDPDLTEEEIRLAKEAAEIAHKAFIWDKADDDIKKEGESTAATK